MESIRELLGSVYDSFFQLKDIIMKWFQSLRGTNPEISNEEMPPMQDGPASRTRSTSNLPPEYDRNGFKSESKNFALKHFGLYPENNSNFQNSNEKVSNFWILCKQSLKKIYYFMLYFHRKMAKTRLVLPLPMNLGLRIRNGRTMIRKTLTIKILMKKVRNMKMCLVLPLPMN